jgi:hypothetical protein
MTFLKIEFSDPDGNTQIMKMDKGAAEEALKEMETWGDDCSPSSKALRDALKAKLTPNPILEKLDALVTLGLPVRTRVEGLKKLAENSPIGTRILEKAMEVLQETNPKRQYWPLLDLLMHERAIAEQCFPDAESTVPEHMRSAPDWLLESPITEAKK